MARKISDPLSDEFDILVDTRDAVSVLSATDLWFLDGLAAGAALKGGFP